MVKNELRSLIATIGPDKKIVAPVDYKQLHELSEELYKQEEALIAKKRIIIKAYGQQAKERCLDGTNSHDDIAVAMDYVEIEYALMVKDPEVKPTTKNTIGYPKSGPIHNARRVWFELNKIKRLKNDSTEIEGKDPA